MFVIEGNINDAHLLKKLFDVVTFTHVMHLAAQAGVRYAMKNPSSYIHSNLAGLVSVLEAANPHIHSQQLFGHPLALFTDSIQKYPFQKKIEQTNQLVFMQLPRKLVKRLHIHTITYMDYQSQDCVFSLFMDRGEGQIWPISSLQGIY